MKPKLNRQKVFYWSLERGDLLPLLLMTPTLLIIFFVMILPLLYGLYLSLFDVGFGTVTAENFVGLANYARFFQDPVAQKAIWNTLLFSAGAIVGDMFFGTVGALLLNKMARWLGNICRPLMTIPLLVSPVVDMPGLIEGMMQAAGVTPEQLEREKVIPMPDAQPLDWEDYCYVRGHRPDS